MSTATRWAGRRVVILGAARQGTALARWLADHGAQVTISDRKQASEVSQAVQALEGVSMRWALGGHPTALLDQCDALLVSGGVPGDLPIVREAARRGIEVANDAQLFMEEVPCLTVGITGSAGKTTTTALLGAMAEEAWPGADRVASGDGRRRVFVGGNIGDPLIRYVDKMRPQDLAIIELSSFQLELMSRSPNIALILNITPNHLDRHGTMEAYTAAKAHILQFQQEGDTAILNKDDVGAWSLFSRCQGRVAAFSLRPLGAGVDGAFLEQGILHLRAGEATLPLLPRASLPLRGDHNVSNALAAFAAGESIGVPLDAMLTAAEAFRGVPHRLELVRELDGVRWYNDSIATAPERTMAALRSFEEPVVLLLGGRDKDLPWEDLAKLALTRARQVLVFGEASGKIETALAAAGVTAAGSPAVRRCANLEEAVIVAAEVARPGDVVLLSPGGTSFDAFADFEQRGERFRECVWNLS